ncbi:glyoxalase [Streptomyces sp. NPDC001262]|uniref:glyoxalase n=1 Tax=Streptomyces TaxID=1883 RepID=UPI003696AFD1
MTTTTNSGGPAGAEGFGFGGLHHVQISIPPGAEALCRAFWGDVLGMTELQKPEALAARGGCWFRGGGVEVHLGVEQDFHPAQKAHPGILVHALHRLAERLEEHGHEVTWDENFPGFDRFHAFDKLGNRLEFMERRPAA